MTALDRKLVRDVWHTKGQVAAICAVIACGVGTFVMSLGTLNALRTTQAAYYDHFRFARVFLQLKRAPLSLIPRLEELPGVSRVYTRVVRDVTLDVPGLSEPAVARLISVPDYGEVPLNSLYLRQGRFVEPNRSSEVLASEGFANAHGFVPGDHLIATINGRKKELEIVGIALSPEYIYQIRGGGDLVPDDKRFAVLWMGRQALAAAFQMEGAFNDVCLDLMPHASELDVLQRLDHLLDGYGGLGAYGREDQVSHRFVSDEIKQLQRMGLLLPSVFLSVAAFLLNVVLSRMISLQRDQIAALKAFGYSNLDVGWHYLKMVFAIVLVGVAAGTAVGDHLGLSLSRLYTTLYHFPALQYRLPPAVVGLSVLISGTAAVVGTLNVIRQAIALPPAEAMRPEPPATFHPTLLERMGLTALLSQPARMILRNLERRRVKSAMSALGIGLGIAILILGHFTSDALDSLLDVQYNVIQRHHVSVNFVEPTSYRAVHEIEHLPGVLDVEPYRIVPVRLRAGSRSRRGIVRGMVRGAHIGRVLDTQLREVSLPSEGLVLNTKLAQLLGVGEGDAVQVEVLEGERPVHNVPVSLLITEHLGTTAYMELPALNRLLREGRAISGAYLTSDPLVLDSLYHQLKQTPRVASVSVKKSTVRSFRDTVIRNISQMQAFNTMFAAVIAFGVVYNTARIALSERSRELATLRVIGFTRAEISFILLGELAALTLLSIPVGLVTGYALARGVASTLDTELYRIPLVISPATYAFSVTVVVVAAVLSGLAVRRRLDHLDLIAVLKTRE